MLDVLVGDGLRRHAGSIRTGSRGSPSCRSSTRSGPTCPPTPRTMWHFAHCAAPARLASHTALPRSTSPVRFASSAIGGQLLRVELARRGEERAAPCCARPGTASCGAAARRRRRVPSAARPSRARRAARWCRRGCRPAPRRACRSSDVVVAVGVIVAAALRAPSSRDAGGFARSGPVRRARGLHRIGSGSFGAADASPSASTAFSDRQLAERPDRLACERRAAAFSSRGDRRRRRRRDPGSCGRGDQLQPGRMRLRVVEQAVDRVGAARRSWPAPSTSSAGTACRLSIARAFTSAAASPFSTSSIVLPACEVVVRGEDVDDAGLLRRGQLRVGEQLAEPRQDRLRPQFPHEVGDLVVPLGEVLVEVGEDRVAPRRIGPAGDVQGGAVEDGPGRRRAWRSV